MVKSGYSGASNTAISHHYDISNDFYELWLDENVVYSCALWGEGDTLESAQLRKLDYFVEQTQSANARRVLDVGCGWGSMLHRLVSAHNVSEVVGLTLSEEQVDKVQSLNIPGCEVRLENWHDHQPTGRYDAIISLGAFEHFARRGLTREQKVAGYRTFFEKCRSWLEPGGRLGLQTLVRGNIIKFDRQYIRDMEFVAEHIYPDTETPYVSEIIEASEKIFDTVAVRIDPHHYERTIQEWRRRLVDNRDRAVEISGRQTYDNYLRYLDTCEHSFKYRFASLFRFTFE
ncbi:class I SAM-dependent methyltransferase [Antrihabitans cavernicola]|uniref:Class I SAM-dependent methyltransferase n=2 Tax=Antrihabitans cavernicola TaxID=2495913 RepID=A0A5A7SEU1_9NOCA|nr:class I SAM-dependent methyltransferase [Spelaeibacter cavernicola]